MLLYSLHYLEKGGMLIYNIGQILTPLNIEIIGFLEKYFKVEIVKPKCEISEKMGGYILYCDKFKPHKDIEKLFKELIKEYPEYGKEWKWVKKYRNTFTNGNGISNYQNELYNKNFKYPTIGNFEKVKQKVLKLNEEYFSNALFDITRISELLERQIPHEEKKKMIEKQKFACLDWAEQFNWRLKPNLNLEPFIDKEGIKIIENIFGFQYLKPLQLTFKNSSSKSPNTLLKLLHLRNRLHLAEVVIDTRDINAYESIKKETDIYRKNLHPIITQKYNAQAVTQAWQKMYELCTVLPLVENDKMKTFHACEAPGSFIIAFNHYLKTKTNVDWDWEAQSLHQTASNKAFGDQFGLMENYPEKWDFGNGSGNITRKNNIEHYIEKCKDVDLITLDCATPLDERDKKMEYLNFSFFYFVLRGTKIGGKALFKMFLNVDKMEIYMLYLLAKSFEKLYFYKPLQNPRSKEIYVLCYNKKENVKDDKIENIFKTKNMNIEFNLPKTFLDELYDIFNFYTEQFEKSMQDKIYYLDNLELMDELDKELIESSIRATNLLWLKRFPLIKLKNSDKLNLKH
jgi:23S rRNA U2552 (ribose-2'-O)-methylase RlmE/FtsJ